MPLAALSALSFISPTWGLIALFLVTSTFFHLSRRMALPLPVGYLEPLETVLALVLIRLAVARSPRTPDALAARDGLHAAERLLLSAILPYALWQTLCSLRGAILWFGAEHARFALRFILSGIAPLALPFLLLRTQASGARVFRAAFWIALAVAAAHLLIQLLDLRSLMQPAYVYSPDYAEYGFVARSQKNAIRTAPIPRLLPQGIVLVSLFAVYAAVRFLAPAAPALPESGSAPRPRRPWDFAPAALLSAAVASTVTRSLLFTVASGIAAGVLLALLPPASPSPDPAHARGLLEPRRARLLRFEWLSLPRPRLSPGRLFAAAVLLAGTALAYDRARPGFLDFWLQRLELLSGPDSQIFSEENEARGRDNIASLRVLRDHPFFGIGSFRYPADYSLRRLPPTDIHPVLQVGLVGGIPAILLFFRMYGVLLLAPVRRLRAAAGPGAARLVPLVAVLFAGAVVSNLSGAGGAVMSAPLLALMLFVGETARVLFVAPDLP